MIQSSTLMGKLHGLYWFSHSVGVGDRTGTKIECN